MRKVRALAWLLVLLMVLPVLAQSPQKVPPRERRKSAIKWTWLYNLPVQQQRDTLKALAHDPAPTTRAEAIRAACSIGDSTALSLALSALKDPDDQVRAMAADMIGRKVPDSSAVIPLIKALSDPSTNVRRAAMSSLRRINDSRAIDPLLKLLNDPTPEVRSMAASCIVAFNSPRIVPELLKSLRDSDDRVRISVVFALGMSKDSTVVSSLIPLLSDGNFEIRMSAVKSLGQLRNRSAVSSLLPLLLDANRSVQTSTAEALGEIKDTASIPQLLPYLNHQTNFIRILTAKALGEMSGKMVDSIFNAAVKQDDIPIIAGGHRYYIRHGVKKAIKGLKQALELFGDDELAIDYLGCEQSELVKSANEWSTKQGLDLVASERDPNQLKWKK